MNKAPAPTLTTSEAIAALGIARRTFQDWKLEPVGKRGNANLYSVQSLIEADREKRAAESAPMNDDQRERLNEARIRLTEGRAIDQERRNAIAEHEVAPFTFVSFVLAQLANAIAAHIDAIPTTLIREAGISVRDAERVKAASNGVANQIAALGDEEWVSEQFTRYLQEQDQ